MSRPHRVFIDTNELFPFTIMDVLLTLADNLVLTWVWTDEVLDEWADVIVRRHHRTPDSARSVTTAIRTAFADSRIDPALYRPHITPDLSSDPDDRAHVAACIHGDVDIVLTRNRADFPEDVLAAHDVTVTTSDESLTELLDQRPTAVQEAFLATAAARRNPPVTPCELIDRIDNAGAHSFAAHMRTRLDCN